MGNFPSMPGPAEAVFAEWLRRRGTPEPDSFDSLLQAHPEQAASLVALHAQWQRLEPVLRLAGFDPAAPASFAELLRAAHGPYADPAISLDAPSSDLGKASSDLLKRLGKKSTGSRYRLEGEVARGGMGAILRVWDEDIRRHLAMKVILGRGEAATEGGTPDVEPGQLARFLEEAQVTGQLDHPGIVPVHELGIDKDGRVFFTMKLVKGRDLKSIYDLVFAGKENWTETRALNVLQKVCEAVAYAHNKGVIHRDLKPANVMVGDFGEVYVMDWGLARVLGRTPARDTIPATDGDSHKSVRTERRADREDSPDSPFATIDGQIVGTLNYMSPEQAQGNANVLDARTDVYAIGAMLYHLLSGQAPYTTKGERLSHRTVHSRLLEGPPKALRLTAEIPPELEAICDKAMARDARARYPGTLALADDLRAFLELRVVRAHETGAWAESKKWVRRNKVLASSLAALFSVTIAGFVVISAKNAQLTAANEAKDSTARGALAMRDALIRGNRERSFRRAMQELAEFRSQTNDPAFPATLTGSASEWWVTRASELVNGRSVNELEYIDWMPGVRDVESEIQMVGAKSLDTDKSHFDDPQDGLWYSQLLAHRSDLIDLQDALHYAHDSLESPPHAQAWEDAIFEISRSEKYKHANWPRGPGLTPQVGLVPIGADPRTGLWEFAHIQSGSPARRAYDNTLILEPDSGAVFVLISSESVIDVQNRPGGVQKVRFIGTPSLFFISKYELTNAQWDKLGGRRRPNPVNNHKAHPTIPVSGVSRDDCDSALDQMMMWITLPRSRQWRIACDIEPVGPSSAESSESPAERLAYPYPVDLSTPNTLGLYGVDGNVWEWCATAVSTTSFISPGESYTISAYAVGGGGHMTTDGTGWVKIESSDDVGQCILMGGAFIDDTTPASPGACRSADPAEENMAFGLRPVRQVLP